MSRQSRQLQTHFFRRRTYKNSCTWLYCQRSCKCRYFLCKLEKSWCRVEWHRQKRSKVKLRWTGNCSSRFHFISLGGICSTMEFWFRTWYFPSGHTKAYTSTNKQRRMLQWIRRFFVTDRSKVRWRMELKGEGCQCRLWQYCRICCVLIK